MSTTDLLSALRAGGREFLSASTVAMGQESGSHVLQIENYTQVREMVANRVAVESSTFEVGGHDWQIECYPNGCTKRPGGSISLFLRRTSGAKESFFCTGSAAVTATIKFSVLDQYGNPSHTKTSPPRRFSSGDDWGWTVFMTNDDLEKEKLLKDGCLFLLCDLTVDLGLRTGPWGAVREPSGEAPAPPFELGHGLAKKIWQKQRADVEIKVGGETLAAHRWMLETESPVFKEELSLAFAAGKHTAKLQIEDMDVEVARTLIEFIYKERLPEEKRLLETAAMAERLLVAADRYELVELKRICEEALCKHISMTSVANTLALAERHGCPALEEACMHFISSPGNLVPVFATDGFEQLKKSRPPPLFELMAKNIALLDLGRTI
jgi:speckle-type POZ protein